MHMNILRDLANLLQLVVCLSAICVAVDQEARPSFSITISAPHAASVGSPVELTIVVRNLTDRSIVFANYGPTRNEKNFTFDVRDAAGNQPSYTAFMKSPAPSFGNLGYLTLRSGESSNFTIDLCKIFELPPGKYTIVLSRLEHAFIRGVAEPSEKEVRSNTITVEVLRSTKS